MSQSLSISRLLQETQESTQPMQENTLKVQEVLNFLTPHLVRQVDQALSSVGAFGEVRLVILKGRLRFIQIVRSESVGDGSSG